MVNSPQRLFLIATILLTTLSSCMDSRTRGLASVIRAATYPPDFNYVSGEELQNSMDQLGFYLQQLDQALEPVSGGAGVQQQEVIAVLGNIERIGTNLRAGDAGSNHPFLEDHMSDFVIQVGRARLAAMANPPSYYLAGRVAGGCVNCHRVNRDL
jgi:hypothetical protein